MMNVRPCSMAQERYEFKRRDTKVSLPGAWSSGSGDLNLKLESDHKGVVLCIRHFWYGRGSNGSVEVLV